MFSLRALSLHIPHHLTKSTIYFLPFHRRSSCREQLCENPRLKAVMDRVLAAAQALPTAEEGAVAGEAADAVVGVEAIAAAGVEDVAAAAAAMVGMVTGMAATMAPVAQV